MSDNGHTCSFMLTLYLGLECCGRGSACADYFLYQTVLYIMDKEQISARETIVFDDHIQRI